jgi:hypothetical protein
MRTKLIAATACAALMWAGGCGPTYYKVTDPTTGKDYYTTELKRDHGTAMLKDSKSGSEVTLQNVEVKKVTKEEYDVGRYAQPAATPEKEKAEATPFK